LLAAGLWLAGRAAPAQQIPVGLGGVPTSFVGLPFDVPLEVDLSGRTDLLGSFALTIQWNPSVLAFVRGQDGNFGALTTNVDSAGGLIRLTGANPGGVGGHVVLGVARFVPLVSAADTFKINVSELYAARTFANLLPSAVWSNKPFCPAVGRYGDIDGNGVANSADALAALTYAVGKSVAGNPAVGDVDGDGITGARDALVILAYAVGLDVTGFRMLAPSGGGCGVAPGRLPLALVPGNVTLDLAQSARYTAVATDSTGVAVAVTDLSWASSDTTVARVDSTGVVTALTPGVANIRVVRLAGDTAAATVTVMQRHTHWVDAMASPEAQDQLGAPELPFRTIPQALAYARPEDTVRVRSGRYDDTLVVNRPVVLVGDTAGGGARPLLSAPSLYAFGVVVNTPGRVEFHGLRIDTLTQGVDVVRADTLLIRDVEFRAPATTYYASLYVDTASAVYIQRSAFYGSGTGYYYYNAGITINRVSLVVIDSSVIAEYGDNGVDLYSVDSALVRGSAFLHNAGYGLYASGAGGGIGTAFTGNRFKGNGAAEVYLSASRGAHFDHNHVLNGGSYGVEITGIDTTAGVTFRGDSLETSGSGYPIWVSTYDTLSLDSTVVLGRSGFSFLSGGRFVSVRNGKFLDIVNGALSLYSSPRDTTFVRLRNVEFRGPQKGVCDRCGYMVYGYTLSVDADSVTMTNMSYGFDLSSSRVVLNHATLQDYYGGLYTDCGYLNVANASFSNGDYGVQGYGCGTGDSIVVASSTFGNQSSAVYASSMAATVVSNSQFANTYYAVSHDCGQLRVGNVAATGGYAGVDASGCGSADTLSIDQSSFAGFSFGAELSYGRQRVQNSRFTDNQYGVYATYAPATITGNQLVRPQYGGIYHYWNSADTSTIQIVSNTLSCDGYGAIYATGIEADHPAGSAAGTVLVQGNTVGNCNEGILLAGGWKAVARANTVGLPTTVTGYRGISVDPDSTAVVAGNTVSGWATQGAIYVANAPRAFVDTNAVSGGIGVALLLANTDSLHARGNTITGQSYGTGTTTPGAAIRLDGGALTGTTVPMAELRFNRITGTTNGIVLNRSANDTLTIRVDSNTVRDADSIGVLVTYYSYARLRYNAIDSAGLDAVRISNSYRAGTAAVVNDNNFSRSQHFGVNNLTASLIDATNNWWGNTTGPACAGGCGAGDSVSTNVTYSPWLNSPFGTYTPAPSLIAALNAAPALALSAPAGATTYRAWQAPSAAARPERPRTLVAPAPLTPAISAAPPLTTTSRVAQRLAAEARVRRSDLERRAASQAAELRRLEAWWAAHEGARAAKLQAETAKRVRQAAPPPKESRQ